MAKKEIFTFLSDDNKTEIHAVKWLPESGEYTAVVQIVHGMIEYVERYEEFASYMTERGYLVVGHDHLGHGDSVGSTEDWGYIAEENSDGHMIEDMHKLRLMTEKENPGMPYFMLGHSMGSYLLRKYITQYGDGLSGALIVGTGSVPDIATKAGMQIAKCMARFKGWRYRSKFVEKLFFSGAYNKFSMDGKDLENNWLTKDLDIAAKYYGEPKCSFRFTLNGYYTVMKVVCYDNQSKNTARIPKDLPIILLSGADDPVGNMSKGVLLVKKQLEEAGIKDLSCKLYENDRHEILNETDRGVVYRDILKWCETRKSPKA
ncbi:MAG: alpha/beta hydrolase [Lachnospiraceae bacterium]|nr:alpha/beta hydrolase [Lachnospiraceae bacterium]